MSELQKLLDRVEKATGPDRELDADLFVALMHPSWVTSKKDPGFAAADKRSFWPEGKARYITRDCKPAPDYTASIDAALALVERALPGHTAGWQPGIGNLAWATIYRVTENEVGMVEKANHATLPLAILAALLKALIAQEARTKRIIEA